MHWRLWQALANHDAVKRGQAAGKSTLTPKQQKAAMKAVKGKSPHKDGNHSSN